jgi:DNA mismatch repair protein MutL
VRFRQPEKVQELVTNAVRRQLHKEDLTAPLRVREAAPAPEPAKAQAAIAFAPAPRAEPRPQVAASRPASPAPPPRLRPVAPAPSAAPLERPRPAPAPERPKAVQMHDLYLIVEVPEGVLVIDQHALHERVLFEQLKARLASGRPEVQKLLIPETITLPPAQAALLLEHQAALGELGLEVADFGAGTVLLSGVPALLGKRPPRDVLHAVVDHLARQERAPTREALLNDLLALLACHAAVRAGDRLSPDEVQALVAQRHLADDSHHCPHGRPSSLLFTRHELDRQFRRVG